MKKYIILSILVITVIIGGYFWFSYMNSFGKVEIELDQNVRASVMHPVGEDTHTDGSDPPVATFTKSFKGKLKRGDYVLVTDKTADFGSQTIDFKASEKPVNLKLQLNYPQEKLESLLTTNRSALKKAFDQLHPEMPDGYRYGKDQMFQSGEWYGGLLVSKNPNLDTLRFVANKKNGVWAIVTDPPDILISSAVYPEIPEDVVRSVNKL